MAQQKSKLDAARAALTAAQNAEQAAKAALDEHHKLRMDRQLTADPAEHADMNFMEVQLELAALEASDHLWRAERAAAEAERIAVLATGDPNALMGDESAVLSDLRAYRSRFDELTSDLARLAANESIDPSEKAERSHALDHEKQQIAKAALGRVDAARTVRAAVRRAWADNGYVGPQPTVFVHVPHDVMNGPARDPWKWLDALEKMAAEGEPESPYARRIERLRQAVDAALISREQSRRAAERAQKQMEAAREREREDAARFAAEEQRRRAAEDKRQAAAAAERQELLAAARARAAEPVGPMATGTPTEVRITAPQGTARVIYPTGRP